MTVLLSNGFFFSEILADNAGGTAFDTDGDGGSNKADEFVEITNVNGGTTNLDGMQIWSAKRGLLYDFTGTDTTASNGTATIVGEWDGAEPTGIYDVGLPDNNNNQGLLEDGENTRFDTLYLLDTITGEYIALSYGDETETINQVPPFDTTGLTLVGAETTASDAPNGTAIARDAAGNLIENTTPTPGALCFVSGTLIETVTGPVRIEDLSVDDMIPTLDQGPQPLRWIGRRSLSAAELAERPMLHPIRIQANALGANLPLRDLCVSPQHRILIASRISERMFGGNGILVPAVKLLGVPGISRMTDSAKDGVVYFHLLFDTHQIITAEGCAAESLLLGPMAHKMLDAPAIAELSELFPEQMGGQAPDPVRPVPSPARIRALLARHARNPRRTLANAA